MGLFLPIFSFLSPRTTSTKLCQRHALGKKDLKMGRKIPHNKFQKPNSNSFLEGEEIALT
jgi:hypothetical protein